jgi:hypothetical protein
MNIRTGASLFISSIAIVFAVVACSSSDSGAGQVCSGSSQCVCNEGCSRKCESGSCQFVCKTGQTCSFDCPDGNCRVECDGTASCNVACPKGGCTVSGGTGAIDVKCGGLSSCVVGCTGATKCDVDGQPASNVSSSGGTSGGTSGTVPEFDAGL